MPLLDNISLYLVSTVLFILGNFYKNPMKVCFICYFTKSIYLTDVIVSDGCRQQNDYPSFYETLTYKNRCTRFS